MQNAKRKSRRRTNADVERSSSKIELSFVGVALRWCGVVISLLGPRLFTFGTKCGASAKLAGPAAYSHQKYRGCSRSNGVIPINLYKLVNGLVNFQMTFCCKLNKLFHESKASQHLSRPSLRQPAHTSPHGPYLPLRRQQPQTYHPP